MARIEAAIGSGTGLDVVEADCSISVEKGDWVYITGPKVAGVYQVDTMDPTDPVKIPTFGIVINKLTTTRAQVQKDGAVSGSDIVGTLIPRKICYVGLDGKTTQIAPSPHYEQPVGVALDTEELDIEPDFPVAPDPVYASHLGTTDGFSDARLPFPSGTPGRVSEPTTPGAPFYSYSKDGDWADPSVDHPGIRTPPAITTPGDVTELDVGTTLRVRFYQYHSSGGNETLIAEESIACNGTDQSSSPNGYISTIGVGTNAGRFEGQVQVDMPLSALVPSGGYIRVRVFHEGTTLGTLDEDWEIFYDPYNTPPFPTTPVVSENTPVLKYLSGIRYYDIGSTFDIAGSISEPFKAMYDNTPVDLDLSQLGISTPSGLDYDDAGISPAHPPLPKWDDILNWLKTVTCDVVAHYNLDAKARQRGRDPFNTSGFQDSGGGPLMFNFTPASSSALDEKFDDENYRLIPKVTWATAPAFPPVGLDNFDSVAVLDNALNDGLQVFGGELIYPIADFSTPGTRLPAQDPLSDYSLLTGARDYQRAFQHDTSPGTRSNAVMYLPGFDCTTIGGPSPHISPGGTGAINMYIQIPGVSTVWFDCGREYFSALFPTVEPGCLVKSLSGVAGGNPSNEYWYFTFGPFSTTLADRTIIVRIDYNSVPTKNFTRVLPSNWT